MVIIQVIVFLEQFFHAIIHVFTPFFGGHAIAAAHLAAYAFDGKEFSVNILVFYPLFMLVLGDATEQFD